MREDLSGLSPASGVTMPSDVATGWTGPVTLGTCPNGHTRYVADYSAILRDGEDYRGYCPDCGYSVRWST